MKLPVKISNDLTLDLTVPDNATVEDLKIAVIVSLPSDKFPLNFNLTPKSINLWYSGFKLDYSKSLDFYNINPVTLKQNSNLIIYLTLDNNNTTTSTTTSTTTNTTNTTIPTIILNNDSAILDDDDDDTNNNEITKKSKHSNSDSSIKSSRSKSRSKSKSKKCHFNNCTSTPLRIVGDCQFCQGKFCSKHRLLENHNCKGLKICKDKCYERNALKLQSEQTVASKV
ncbi:hypothetical protein C6P40_001232 [Pichia californica]|uniref:AN1-type domain-containing protein n=1 Tax=Pichia californica TaxID=460514 RepID=A0A9P7BID3_9ASCO|nr:hypothetical protein C6P42_004412 [[Candida] californica]KAG0690798.1 hypothetical protein C6P40_001232 [[Candida] californica]